MNDKEHTVFRIEVKDLTKETMKELNSAMYEWQAYMVEHTKEQAEKLGLTYAQAEEIVYLRSRSRWTQEKENEMIKDFQKDNNNG